MLQSKIRLLAGLLPLLLLYVSLNWFFQSQSGPLRNKGSSPNQGSELVVRGQQLTENCTACHYLDQKANFVGPHLVGLIGRPVADVSDFEYSPAVRKLGGNWTEARLTEFLSAPQRYAPGTKMALQGWTAEDAKAIAAYFESRN